MTIAISLKVNDGVVLASDSATTLIGVDPQGVVSVANVYDNANKVFNLYKTMPIGLITWGAGNILIASISTLVKDLRQLLMTGPPEWKIDETNYSVEEVAHKVRRFMFEDKYTAGFANVDEARRPLLGFVVAGYSSNGDAEEYFIQVHGGKCDSPMRIRARDEVGVTWNGETEALSRLILGVSPMLAHQIKALTQMPDAQLQQFLNALIQPIQSPLVQAAMPIQDAIDLAHYLVRTAIEYSRFMPGPQTVGGPVEIAAITKHEGFRWIQRKHYFRRKLNRPEIALPKRMM